MAADYTFERYTGRGTQPYRFRIRAMNGQIVGRGSEGYTTKRKRNQTVRNMARSSGWPVIDT